MAAGTMYNDAKKLIEYRGETVRFRYFTPTFNTGSYDSEPGLAISGTDLWISGFPQSLNSTQGSDDAVQLEQGRLLMNDLKLYVEGNTSTTPLFKVGIGSPIRDEYAMIEIGVDAPLINGSAIYKRIYLRRLSTGSILGE